MRDQGIASLALALCLAAGARADDGAKPPRPLPGAADGWSIELVAEAPAILFPTAVVAAPDGTVYLGQDPMDMLGPPTVPADSVVALRGGKTTVFANKLWAVMGLEWVDGALYVVHPPYLSAFRDTDGDGKADRRDDLVTGFGPDLPGFNGINDHVASGLRLGNDGFLYVSVGDKGLPKAVGKDGATVRLFGGGVVRVRPDGTGLEVVSTGERNPLSVALSATDDVFTYGNDDDSKQWPNSLTHHILGGHYGYPYQFLSAPQRCLPVVAGQVGGSGAQGVCYNEAGLPEEFRGNLFFCDWGLQTVDRFVVEPKGGTFALKSRTTVVSKGDLDDFRPFSLAVLPDGSGFYLVDWAFNGWLAGSPKTGRLYKLTYRGKTAPATPAEPGPGLDGQIEALDHPALSVRRDAQRRLAAGASPETTEALIRRVKTPQPVPGRVHALWALDGLTAPAAREAIRSAIGDPEAVVRREAARSAGVRRDRAAKDALLTRLRDDDPTVRREAAIALGRLGDPSAAPGLLDALGERDAFAAWSVRSALKRLDAWDARAVEAALLDPKRRDAALVLCDETWAPPVVDALNAALPKTEPAERRARLVATLGGLYRKYPEWSGRWFGTNPLVGRFPQKSVDWDNAAMGRVQQGLTLALGDKASGVRLQAIAGLFLVGKPALASLRSALSTEADPKNLGALAQGLGALRDFPSAPSLGAVVLNAEKPESVRIAALDALGQLAGPQALNARLSVVYDPKAPAPLVARALPALGLQGILPPNDLAGFLEHASADVRAAALRGFAVKRAKPLPKEVVHAIVTRFDDPSPEVRNAATSAAAVLELHDAVGPLLAMALNEEKRPDAVRALAAMPDHRALPVYLAALRDKSPEVRESAERALSALRAVAESDLHAAARSGKYEGPAALALERVVTSYRPLTDWRVIGPFARTTPRVFVGEPAIDFARTHSGPEGRPIAWKPRAGDPATGRVSLNAFKGSAGDRGGFGYDTNGSPDLCAFGYAEVRSETDRDAFLRVGSSGSLTVTVNEQAVVNYRDFAGRPYAANGDVVKVKLARGVNRLLVVSRQGIGEWAYSVQVSDPLPFEVAGARVAATGGPDALREFALKHEGDARAGEAIFFDPKGIGCAKCHAADGRGAASIGPDLTGLALKYDKAEIVRSVLEPSNRIATGYQPVTLATRDGKVHAGLVRSESESEIELADAGANVTRFPLAEVEERRVGGPSVMPAGLADSLTPVEFADLISYLTSLKSAPARADHR